jgi:predicted nucleic acid-binding protein
MKNFIVIDTCIILHILRNNVTGQRVLDALANFEDEPALVVSTVTKGELESLKKQQNWGETRCKFLNTFLETVTYIDVNNTDETLHIAYSDIDAFSKRKITDAQGNLLIGSAKTMGKNDLWIAATANALNANLMTTDGDFDHLDKVYVNLMKF